MKRIGNLFSQICSIDNLELADKKARKNKRNRRDVLLHDKDRDLNILRLNEALVNKTFTTSKYKVFKIFEGKERIISKLPYYPDRILHHALMNVLELYLCLHLLVIRIVVLKAREYMQLLMN